MLVTTTHSTIPSGSICTIRMKRKQHVHNEKRIKQTTCTVQLPLPVVSFQYRDHTCFLSWCKACTRSDPSDRLYMHIAHTPLTLHFNTFLLHFNTSLQPVALAHSSPHCEVFTGHAQPSHTAFLTPLSGIHRPCTTLAHSTHNSHSTSSYTQLNSTAHVHYPSTHTSP